MKVLGANPRSTPPVSKQLLDWLEQIFPDRISHMNGASWDEVNQALGQQQVIAKLRSEFALQNNINEDEE